MNLYSESTSIESVLVDEIKPHPDNQSIYQDEATPEQVESVREYGVMIPLVLNGDNTLLSGHRRLDAARKAGRVDVPCVILKGLTPQEESEILVRSNQYREKTPEQIGREIAYLRRIYEQQKKPGKSRRIDSVDNSRQSEESLARAAAVVGVPAQTARRAQRVVEHIDQLKAAGKTEEAAATSAMLRERGVRPVLEAIETPRNRDMKGTPVPTPLVPVFAWAAEARKVLRQMQAAFGTAKDVVSPEVVSAVGRLSLEWESLIPHSVCQKCDGKGCSACGKRGYLAAGGK